MKQHFPKMPFAFQSKPESSETVEDEPRETGDASRFQFSYKPREIKEHLDRFVIKQDEAKKVLSVAMCDHYHHVRLAMEEKEQPNYTKQNIILLGPTGVGKTYLVRCIAELIGVPFVKADATKFSETGYVGGDVEDLVRELVRRADGDVQRADQAHAGEPERHGGRPDSFPGADDVCRRGDDKLRHHGQRGGQPDRPVAPEHPGGQRRL